MKEPPKLKVIAINFPVVQFYSNALIWVIYCGAFSWVVAHTFPQPPTILNENQTTFPLLYI